MEIKTIEGKTFVKVIDVSKYQDSEYIPGLPDLKQAVDLGVKVHGIRLVSNGTIDRMAEYFWKNSLDSGGVPFGYAWFDYRDGIMKSVKAQAEGLLEALYRVNGSVENELVFIDYEQPNNSWPPLPSYYTGIRYLTEWFNAVDLSTNRLSGFYGNRNSINSISPVPYKTTQRPLWIAAYPTNALVSFEERAMSQWRPFVSPWRDWTFWQFGFVPGKIHGVETEELDGDFFNGTKEQLFELLSKSIDEEEPIDLETQVDNIEAYAKNILNEVAEIRKKRE